MKINDLSKKLEITNKELIQFFRNNGYSNISSHMQNVTDEMYNLATEKFVKTEESVVKDEPKEVKKKEFVDVEVHKKYDPDELIPCRSVCPWKLNALGVDRVTVYHWEYFGDVDYVKYRDLQAMRRKDYITKPKIIIEDADLCYQWRRELGDTYNYFIGVQYPEEFFDKNDDEFATLLRKAPDTIKEVIRVTAVNMIKNENYPSIAKLDLIDKILGTCLKEFI